MVQIHSPRFRFNDLTRLCSRALGARRRISSLLSRVSPPDPEMRGAVSHPVSQGIERAHNRPGKNSIARDPAGRRPESSRRGFGLAGWRELAPSCASPRRARHVPRRTPNPCWPDRPIPPDSLQKRFGEGAISALRFREELRRGRRDSVKGLLTIGPDQKRHIVLAILFKDDGRIFGDAPSIDDGSGASAALQDVDKRFKGHAQHIGRQHCHRVRVM